MKKTNSNLADAAVAASPSSLLVAEDTESLASKLKVSYEDKKKNFSLASIQSHKDIVKQLKSKKEVAATAASAVAGEKTSEEKPTANFQTTQNKIVASDFLLSRITEIKRFTQSAAAQSSPQQAKAPPKVASAAAAETAGFDLELYIGDSPTTQKLLDVSAKYQFSCPATKRKAAENESSPISDENNSGLLSAAERQAKKLRTIEELKGIKSNHAKDVMDPEKNVQYRNYLERLQQQEDIDNKLCSTRNREVNAVSCKVCDYTAFSQSDYCKRERHSVARRSVLQRFFRCKACKERMFTLDRLVPTRACAKCGAEKYEPCMMKDDTCAQNVLINVTTNLDFDSEVK